MKLRLEKPEVVNISKLSGGKNEKARRWGFYMKNFFTGNMEWKSK